MLVPQIVRTLKSKDAETKLNKLITLAITLLLGVTLLMAVATPLLTKLYVNGSAETMALATSFTLWCMPQIFFYGLYTVIGQILAAKDHFVTYAWSSVGANIISCIGFGAFIAMFGRATERPLDFWTPTKIALTAGTWTLGVAFQALVLFIPLTRIGLNTVRNSAFTASDCVRWDRSPRGASASSASIRSSTSSSPAWPPARRSRLRNSCI